MYFETRTHHQHTLGLRQLVALVDVHVGLEVLQQILGAHLLPVDELGHQVLRRQQHRHQLLQRALELHLDVCGGGVYLVSEMILSDLLRTF